MAAAQGNPIEHIAEIGPIDIDQFHREFVKAKRPVIMRGGAAHWPAVRNWSFDYIGALRPELPVVLEVGNVMQHSGRIEHATLRDYTDLLQGISSSKHLEGAYLSIFDMFEEIPQLRSDVDFGLLSDRMFHSKMVGWLGPRGTVTGYHADWGHNLFAQIIGVKRFHLVDEAHRDSMYRNRRYDPYSYMSDIDLAAWSPEQQPKYADVPVAVVDLGPGDLMYVPPYWWHHVESLEASVSANNFSFRFIRAAMALVEDRLKRWRTPDDREHNVVAGREPQEEAA